MIFDDDPDDPEPIAAWFAGHPAWEDCEECEGRDCPMEMCRDERLRLERQGTAILARLSPDDSDLTNPETLP